MHYELNLERVTDSNMPPKNKSSPVKSSGVVKKKRRLDVLISDESPTASSPPVSPFIEEGQAGLIEKVVLKNFMCHLNLEFTFGPHVNFIIGRNGTGKSAVLYGIYFALGGKSRNTGKNASLSDFIHDGKQSADISVTLKNCGLDAYREEVYGERIIIERHLQRKGNGTYKIKADSGKLISVKYEELSNILESLNIQVENPVSVLTQDISRTFLESRDPKKKYSFFFKGTQLERLWDDYSKALEKNEVANSTLKMKKENLATAEKEVKKSHDDVKNLKSLSKHVEEIKNRENEFLWACVAVQEAKQEKCQKAKDLLNDELEKCKANREKIIIECSQSKEIVHKTNSQHKEGKKKIAQMENQNCDLMAKKGRKTYETKNDQLHIERLNNHFHSASDDIDTIEKNLNSHRSQEDTDSEHKIFAHKSKLRMLENQLNVIVAEDQEIKDNIQRDNTKLQNCINEENDHKFKLKRKKEELQTMQLGLSNKIRRYGLQMGNLLQKIVANKGKFNHVPLGPIGNFITVKEDKWSFAIEMCLKPILYSFWCDNVNDQNILQSIMNEVYGQQQRPSIIICTYLPEVYDVSCFQVKSDIYSTVLECISCSEPVITNCLIDQMSIERVILIEGCSKASEVMLDCPPRQCKKAFTENGDEVFPSPRYQYYSCTREPNTSMFLHSYTKDDVKMKQAEITSMEAKMNAALLEKNRLQNQLSSHSKTMRALNEKTVVLKKNIFSVQTELQDLEHDDSSMDVVEQQAERKRLQLWYEKLENELNAEKKELQYEKKLSEKLTAEYKATSQLIDAKKKEIDKRVNELLIQQTKENQAVEKLAKLEKDIEMKEIKLVAAEDLLRQTTADMESALAKASSACSRVTTSRMPKQIMSEITELRNASEEYSGQFKDKDIATQSYVDKKTKLDTMVREIANLKCVAVKMTKLISARMKKFEEMRSQTVVSIQLMFQLNMKTRSYNGKLAFEHVDKKLVITAKHMGGKGEEDQKTASLSGGERSFLTIAFLLALYDATEMPFHLLDEYDVFMDSLNRSVSMEFMMSMAKRKSKIQFIFLTPLELPPSIDQSMIQIHRMPDIVRSRENNQQSSS